MPMRRLPGHLLLLTSLGPKAGPLAGSSPLGIQ